MNYEYKIVPFQAVRQSGKQNYQAGMEQLHDVIAAFVNKGWEFYRMEEYTIQIPPGCLGAFLGQKTTYERHQVIVFRIRSNS